MLGPRRQAQYCLISVPQIPRWVQRWQRRQTLHLRPTRSHDQLHSTLHLQCVLQSRCV